jgi:hypothetical protein
MDTTASSTGDLGDCVAGVLGVLFEIQGKHSFYLRDSRKGERQTKGIVKRSGSIIPLIESQSYIKECKVCDDQPMWDSQAFRNGFHSTINTLLHAHGRHAHSVGVIDHIPSGENPWLFVEPNKDFEGRVVINRSPRYINSYFRWDEVWKKYGKRCVFLGLEYEHRAFVQSVGEVEYRPVKDFLDGAQIIAGSDLYCGNQSAFMAVAEGLKVRRIQETCLNPVDCIYPGSHNAQYVADGSMVLPGLDGEDDTHVPSKAFSIERMSLAEVPPGGGWIYDHEGFRILESTLDKSAKKLARLSGMEQPKARSLILLANLKRVPQHFRRMVSIGEFVHVQQALQNAGIQNHPLLAITSPTFAFEELTNP